MARIRQPIPTSLEGDAVRVRARRELADLEQARFVSKALAEGASQDAVADALGLSQAGVSRLAARIKDYPDTLRPTINEIVHKVATKEINRPETVRQLRALRIAYVKPEVAPNSDWAALTKAVRSGVLPRAVAREVAEDTARRFVARVTGAMDLEDQSVEPPAVKAMVKETTERMVKSFE